MATRARRTCLTMPGSSERRLAKAATLAADEMIVDLEDGVAPGEKTDATRTRAVEAVRGRPAPTTALRVNAQGTPWWRDDLAAAADAHAERILAAPEGAGVVDGEMVDAVSHRLARALLARTREPG